MHTTRVHVDELLAAGKVKEAETYMEQRRQVFWIMDMPSASSIRPISLLWGLRRCSGGAAGEDPVGPAVRTLRSRSSSLLAFLERLPK